MSLKAEMILKATFDTLELDKNDEIAKSILDRAKILIENNDFDGKDLLELQEKACQLKAIENMPWYRCRCCEKERRIAMKCDLEIQTVELMSQYDFADDLDEYAESQDDFAFYLDESSESQYSDGKLYKFLK